MKIAFACLDWLQVVTILLAELVKDLVMQRYQRCYSRKCSPLLQMWAEV
jgi:hypothetical protein